MRMMQCQWQVQEEERVCCEICGRDLEDLPGMQHQSYDRHASPDCIGNIYREKRAAVEEAESSSILLRKKKVRQAKKEFAEVKRKHAAVLGVLTALRTLMDDKYVVYTAEKGITSGDKTIDVSGEMGNRLGK